MKWTSRSSAPSVEVLDLGLKWDGGAPMPQLLMNHRRAVVLCYESLATGEGEFVMEVAFTGCVSARMGGPNDEALHGHPLYEHGLKFYEAHRVANSPWLAEQRAINAVHEYHDDRGWDRYNHYLLAFHDEMVEALATSIAARRLAGSMAEELARLASEMAEDA